MLATEIEREKTSNNSIFRLMMVSYLTSSPFPLAIHLFFWEFYAEKCLKKLIQKNSWSFVKPCHATNNWPYKILPQHPAEIANWAQFLGSEYFFIFFLNSYQFHFRLFTKKFTIAVTSKCMKTFDRCWALRFLNFDNQLDAGVLALAGEF